MKKWKNKIYKFLRIIYEEYIIIWVMYEEISCIFFFMKIVWIGIIKVKYFFILEICIKFFKVLKFFGLLICFY